MKISFIMRALFNRTLFCKSAQGMSVSYNWFHGL